MLEFEALFDHIKDTRLREALQSRQSEILAEMGMTFDRMILFLTHVFNKESVREIILQSSYSKFINSISKDLIENAFESNELFCKDSISNLLRKLVCHLRDRDHDLRETIFAKFETYGQVLRKKDSILLKTLRERHGNTMK